MYYYNDASPQKLYVESVFIYVMFALLSSALSIKRGNESDVGWNHYRGGNKVVAITCAEIIDLFTV